MDCIIKKVDHRMMGSFDIHILDPNFITWSMFRGVFGGRKLFLPGHFGLIFDGRVETCFYCEVSYGPLVGCVIGGVTQGHRHSVAITTGAERQGLVTNRGRDWSVATPIPDR